MSAARLCATLSALMLVTACTTPTTPPMSAESTRAPAVAPAVVAALAPTGTLRAAINFGNPILATRDAASGEPRGVSVDLARELARRLGVPVALVTYDAAGKVVDGLKGGAWDVAFLAIDPERAVDIAYTAPYVIIEGVYLVKHASPVRQNADVDRAGVRVAVGAGSAYDLYLSRALKQATIVRAPSSPLVVDTFVAQGLDVAAGVRQQLEADARRVPGLRIVAERFMVIEQAMGTPRQRDPGGVRYLHEYVEAMKASGFVAAALARHGIEGAGIAPAAAP